MAREVREHVAVAALAENGHCYVLADGSGRLEPTLCARRVVSLHEA